VTHSLGPATADLRHQAPSIKKKSTTDLASEIQKFESHTTNYQISSHNVETRKVSAILDVSNCPDTSFTDISPMYSRADWADDEEFDDPSVLPPQQVIPNKDGTKTVVSYRFNDDGKKVKVTRRIRTTVVKEHVNPKVAERRAWPKFGLEKGHAPGPSFDTTSVGENIIFRPSINWKAQAQEAEKEGEKGGIKDQLKDKKVKCRICSGEHFTARCPFKDTMAPVDEAGAGSGGDGDEEASAAGGLGDVRGSYVPPHLRKGGAGAGERMGGKFERDDLATLRVTNVSVIFLLYIPRNFALTGIPGERAGRGAGTPGSIRTIWTRHQSVLGPGPRNPAGQGLCIYQLCRPQRCCSCLREAGWL
jgi:translation initiation factor 3 subunit G